MINADFRARENPGDCLTVGLSGFEPVGANRQLSWQTGSRQEPEGNDAYVVRWVWGA